MRILKAEREKQLVMYKGTTIRLSADFSTETLQAGKDWHNIVKVRKGGEKKNYHREYSTWQGYHSDWQGR